MGTTDSQASYARLVALPPGEERNQLVCSDSVKTFEALTTCLQSVGKSYPLSFVLFKSQPKFKQTIKEAVATHNQSCPAQPLTVPSF